MSPGGSPTGPAGSAELADRSALQHADHGTHTGRCGSGREPRARRCRPRSSSVRLPEPPYLRRRGRPGQSRCESEPDDHGDGRAGDGSYPRQAGYPDHNPPREVDPLETGNGMSVRAVVDESNGLVWGIGPTRARVAHHSSWPQGMLKAIAPDDFSWPEQHRPPAFGRIVLREVHHG